MVLDQKEKNNVAHKMFLASTNLSQAGTYTMRGNYRKTYDNLIAAAEGMLAMAKYLKVHIED